MINVTLWQFLSGRLSRVCEVRCMKYAAVQKPRNISKCAACACTSKGDLHRHAVSSLVALKARAVAAPRLQSVLLVRGFPILQRSYCHCFRATTVSNVVTAAVVLSVLVSDIRTWCHTNALLWSSLCPTAHRYVLPYRKTPPRSARGHDTGRTSSALQKVLPGTALLCTRARAVQFNASSKRSWMNWNFSNFQDLKVALQGICAGSLHPHSP